MSAYFVLYGIARFFIEGIRTDSLMWGAMRASQVVSILLIVAGLAIGTYLIIKHFKNKNKIDNDIIIIGANNGKLQERE